MRSPVDTLEEVKLKHLLTTLCTATALLAAPAFADDSTFNEDAVAAMKGGIVIEAPWAVSLKDDEVLVFMTIHNGSDDADTIKSVSSKAAENVAIAKFDGGAMQNSEDLETLDTPKGEATNLTQDGYHLRLTDLKEKVKSGDTISLQLDFEETGDLMVDVSVAVMN